MLVVDSAREARSLESQDSLWQSFVHDGGPAIERYRRVAHPFGRCTGSGCLLRDLRTIVVRGHQLPDGASFSIYAVECSTDAFVEERCQSWS